MPYKFIWWKIKSSNFSLRALNIGKTRKIMTLTKNLFSSFLSTLNLLSNGIQYKKLSRFKIFHKNFSMYQTPSVEVLKIIGNDFFMRMLSLTLMAIYTKWANQYLQIFDFGHPPNITPCWSGCKNSRSSSSNKLQQQKSQEQAPVSNNCCCTL